jgi:transketolase
MKLAFVNALVREAEKNPRIMLLTGDLGYEIFNPFIDRFGPRYVNVGVAEAQLMCTAAGLALAGWRPFTYSIASFATARCYEQIKLAVAYHQLPVVVVGAGGGYAYGHSGVTHHAGDDLALMRSLPGMTVVAPGDVHEVEALLPQVIAMGGPAYFRIGRGKEPQYPHAEPVYLGKARCLADGEGVALLSTGEVAWEAYSVIDKLHAVGIRPLVYQFHTVKPLDSEVLRRVASRAKLIFVLDEHSRTGGFVSAVSDWIAERGLGLRVIPICPKDEFILGSPHQHEIRQRYGLNSDAIIHSITSCTSAEAQP